MKEITFTSAIECANWINAHITDAREQESAMFEAVMRKKIEGTYKVIITLYKSYKP